VGTLVRTLQGPTIASDLERAFVALSRAYLDHRGGGCSVHPVTEAERLDSLVRRAEEPIDLKLLRVECPLIGTDSERPIEVFNNLGHMFVLLHAIRVLHAAGLAATACAPTQQSSDEAGQGIPDLSGTAWALEAYGGTDITNNGKLARDLRYLASWAAVGRRTFLACRSSAWRVLLSISADKPSPIAAWCSRKHGGPIRASASARLLARSEQVAVVEVEAIRIGLDP
jgi:hypothetical protein